MKKNRVGYAFIDPSSGGYSASRIASLWLIAIDMLWALAAVLGIPPKEALVPVSSMLSACTVAAFGAYGLNSFGRTWQEGKCDIDALTAKGPPPKKEG